MQALSRRRFLELGLISGSSALAPNIASSARFAKSIATPSTTATACCSSLKILEIFCYGGLSQWENFWLSQDDPSDIDGLNWRGARDDVAALDWVNCGNNIDPLGHVHFADAEDENDAGTVTTPVFWGPATQPIWHLRNRCRAVVVKPSDMAGVHLLGIHKGLTGHRLGDPRAAGLGTAVAYHSQLQQPQDLPYSYVLGPKRPGGFGYVTNFAMAPGVHPGWASPLAIKLGDNGFGEVLAREGMSSARDQLLSALNSQYGNMLKFHGAGLPVNARGFTSFDAAVRYTTSATAELEARIGGDALAVDEQDNCVTHQDPDFVAAGRENSTRKSIELAAYLLSKGNARHVTVLDGGIHRVNGDSPYDTHNNSGSYSHAQVTSGNLWNVLDALASIVNVPQGGATPTELGQKTVPIDPIPTIPSSGEFQGNEKISLSDTLIVLHTEFNRTPSFKSTGGRDHSERSGHVALLFGGPVSGQTIAGNIRLASADNVETADPSTYATPTDLRAAILLAAGIDPFEPQNFRTSDGFGPQITAGAGLSEENFRDNLSSAVLGVG